MSNQEAKPSPVSRELNVADAVEQLRQILTEEQHREITYSEASEVGESLIKFYEILAGAVD